MSTKHDSETWRDVKGHEGFYQVSNLGRVKSLPRTQLRGPSKRRYSIRGKILKPMKQNTGYLHVELGKGNVKSIHRLVLETFVGPCPDGMQCLHKNGNPADNRLRNLKWGTPKENAKDRRDHGRAFNGPKGDTHPFAKLTSRMVRRIRSRYTAGCITLSQLSRRYKVHVVTLSEVIRRVTWKHV